MFSELINFPYFLGIVAVIVGFMLGEGSRYVRYRLRVRELKRMVKEELKSIRSQIPQKKDIVNKIIKALEEQQLLGGSSVGIITTGYKQHIPELYEHLCFLQRNCLHVIYERLDVADKMLSSFERDFITAKREQVLNNPFDAYKKRFQDILESYVVVEDLIKGYLDGKPEDVFHINEK